jgi:hypothetical protein
MQSPLSLVIRSPLPWRTSESAGLIRPDVADAWECAMTDGRFAVFVMLFDELQQGRTTPAWRFRIMRISGRRLMP